MKLFLNLKLLLNRVRCWSQSNIRVYEVSKWLFIKVSLHRRTVNVFVFITIWNGIWRRLYHNFNIYPFGHFFLYNSGNVWFFGQERHRPPKAEGARRPMVAASILAFQGTVLISLSKSIRPVFRPRGKTSFAKLPEKALLHFLFFVFKILEDFKKRDIIFTENILKYCLIT